MLVADRVPDRSSSLVRPNTLLLLPSFVCQAPFTPANRFFALYATQFAFGNEPSLAPDSAQYTAARDFFPEALHHLLLRFIGSEFNSYSQDFSHPFFSAITHKGRDFFPHPFVICGLEFDYFAFLQNRAGHSTLAYLPTSIPLKTYNAIYLIRKKLQYTYIDPSKPIC